MKKQKKDAQRTSKTKPFINKYNWESINYLSEKGDWKKNQKNNVKIALNVLYAKKEKIYPAYLSKHNSNCEKQVIHLMISNGEKQWHYLAVKKLSASSLLNFIVSIAFILSEQKKLQSYKRVCENKDFFLISMPSDNTKKLEFNQYQTSDKAPFIIQTYRKCIKEKIAVSKNNPENLFTTKVSVVVQWLSLLHNFI